MKHSYRQQCTASRRSCSFEIHVCRCHATDIVDLEMRYLGRALIPVSDWLKLGDLDLPQPVLNEKYVIKRILSGYGFVQEMYQLIANLLPIIVKTFKMEGTMKLDKFKIRWVDSVHTGDDFELILQTIEMGRDEGPIILVPRRSARKPGSQKGADYQALVFDNPDWLDAHFMEHQDELNHEIWLGICENVPREKRPNATGALLYFANLLNELGGRNRKSPRSVKAISSSENLISLTYGAVKESPIESFDALIEQSGEAFESLAADYKNLPKSILISRA